MRLEELLDHTRVFLDDATDIIDGDPDQLFSDELIVRYLNEAQRILCRRSWTIIEYGVAPAGVLTLATEKSLYKLHPSVLRVIDATPASQVAPLGRTTDAALRGTVHTGDAFDVGEAASLAGTALTGAPLAGASDAGTLLYRVYPTPTADQNGLKLLLKIARLPICLLDVNKMNDSPEVPEQWHLALTGYAAGRCLMQPNLDSQSKSDGRELLSQWDVVVREARQERQRAEMDDGRWAFASSTAAIR